MRRLLVVSHRPLDFGGGGAARWRYLSDALPGLGWQVVFLSPERQSLGSNESSTSDWQARAARVRARVTGAVGRIARPLVTRGLQIQPEALAPSGLWSLTGRATVRSALERLQPDAVLATGPPVAALFATAHVMRTQHVPFVAEFRDLWAGNPYYDAGGWILPAIERGALSAAERVFVVTEGCRARFSEVHPELDDRVRVFPNGFDPGLLAFRASVIGIEGRRTLIHAGGLYGDRSPEQLLSVLASEEFVDAVSLRLIGPTDQAARQTAAAARARGVDVSVEDPVSWRSAIEMTRAADIAVVINSPRTGGDMALPGKLFEALALGKPVLALTSPGSDTERVMESLGLREFCAPISSPDAIARALRALLTQPPAPTEVAALAPWNRQRIAEQLAGELDELLLGQREMPL